MKADGESRSRLRTRRNAAPARNHRDVNGRFEPFLDLTKPRTIIENVPGRITVRLRTVASTFASIGSRTLGNCRWARR